MIDDIFKSKQLFSAEQIAFMNQIGITIDFRCITDDDLSEIEDKVAYELQTRGFDKNGDITEYGIMCESILDRLSEL